MEFLNKEQIEFCISEYPLGLTYIPKLLYHTVEKEKNNYTTFYHTHGFTSWPLMKILSVSEYKDVKKSFPLKLEENYSNADITTIKAQLVVGDKKLNGVWGIKFEDGSESQLFELECSACQKVILFKTQLYRLNKITN
jgi:hypothetical protein